MPILNKEKHKDWVAEKSENPSFGYEQKLKTDMARRKMELIDEARRTGNTLAVEGYQACDPDSMLTRLREVQRKITDEDMYQAALNCARVIPNGGLVYALPGLRRDSIYFMAEVVIEIAKRMGKNVETTITFAENEQVFLTDDWILSGDLLAGYTKSAAKEHCKLDIFVAGGTRGGLNKVKEAGGKLVNVNVIKAIPSVEDVLTDTEMQIAEYMFEADDMSENKRNIGLKRSWSGAIHEYKDSDNFSSGILLETDRRKPYPKDVVGWVDRFWKGEK